MRVGGRDIAEVSSLTIADALSFLQEIDAGVVSARILAAPLSRLRYLERVGLGYLTLDRPRADALGRRGPARGLDLGFGGRVWSTPCTSWTSPPSACTRATWGRLVEAMISLRDSGNSLVVVEHEESVVLAADHLVEVGPGAGEDGGRVVHAGPVAGILGVEDSPTGRVLSGPRPRPRCRAPDGRRTWDRSA